MANQDKGKGNPDEKQWEICTFGLFALPPSIAPTTLRH